MKQSLYHRYNICIKKENCYFLKKLNNFPTLKIILSLFLIATVLNIAFPPIVSEEIKAAVITLIKDILTLVMFAIDIASTAPSPPETIPHISPTISLHILDILTLFLISLIVSLAP